MSLFNPKNRIKDFHATFVPSVLTQKAASNITCDCILVRRGLNVMSVEKDLSFHAT
jgi:hypothetical protein